jgi:hypothetical protein
VFQVLPAFLLLLPFVTETVSGQANNGRLRQGQRLWLLVFLGLALALLYPRYSTLHWAAAVPFLAMISGIACADLVKQRSGDRPLGPGAWSIYLSFVLLWIASATLVYLPRLTGPQTQMVAEYSPLVTLADDLKRRDLPDEGLVLFPDDEGVSNLYYLLQRPPPMFWLMHYPWFVNRDTVAHWLEVVERERPQTLLYFKDRNAYEQAAPEIVEYIQTTYSVVNTIPWNGQQVLIMQRLK